MLKVFHNTFKFSSGVDQDNTGILIYSCVSTVKLSCDLSFGF